MLPDVYYRAETIMDPDYLLILPKIIILILIIVDF